MKNLSQFAPAETLLLIEGKNAQLKDLLKVTLMDLFLKQALQTIEISSPSTSKSLPVPNTYVVSGANLGHYRPMAHEDVFLSAFYQNAERQILFNNLIKIGYEKAKTEKHYGKLILKNKKLDRYFLQGFITLFKGNFSLTTTGEQMAGDIRAEITNLETTLPLLMKDDPSKAMEVMKMIGGNIFLVKGIDLKLMREIETHVASGNTRLNHSSYSSTSDTLTWIALDSHAHHFDNSGSNDSGWHSGDSLDSDSSSSSSDGDSGCSGCGGD
jgi:hypothetical protein